MAAGSPVNDPNRFRGPLKHHCGLCLDPGSRLSRCTACGVVRYCSREHQVQHRSEHKSICNKIKKLRTELDVEDRALRNPTSTALAPANPFETHVGRFWRIPGAPDYMRARIDLAEQIRTLGTLDGVTESLDHLQELLRLCRTDNLGARDFVPPMMLQLDQDAECYDFVKWYAIDGQQPGYDWGNVNLPYLSVKGANVLEDVAYLGGLIIDIDHIAAVLLLKLKLLVDLINIMRTRKVVRTRLPAELWSHVELHVIRSPISRRWVGQPHQRLTGVQQTLVLHIKHLAKFMQNKNEHFLSVLLDPDENGFKRPEGFRLGSVEEAEMLFQFSYAAWWQHEGVVELLLSAKSIAGKDSEDEIDDMMGGSTFRNNPGSNGTREELLDDVSINRLWEYFDDAVEDAMSLSITPPSEITRLRQQAAW